MTMLNACTHVYVHASNPITGLGEPPRLLRPWPEQYLDFIVIIEHLLGE